MQALEHSLRTLAQDLRPPSLRLTQNFKAANSFSLPAHASIAGGALSPCLRQIAGAVAASRRQSETSGSTMIEFVLQVLRRSWRTAANPRPGGRGCGRHLYVGKLRYLNRADFPSVVFTADFFIRPGNLLLQFSDTALKLSLTPALCSVSSFDSCAPRSPRSSESRSVKFL